MTNNNIATCRSVAFFEAEAEKELNKKITKEVAASRVDHTILKEGQEFFAKSIMREGKLSAKEQYIKDNKIILAKDGHTVIGRRIEEQTR